MDELALLYTAGSNVRCTTTLKVNWLLPNIPDYSAISFLGIYQREMNACIYTKSSLCSIAAISVIAPNWKQSKCSSTCTCANKWWYIHSLEYNLAINKECIYDTCDNMSESQNTTLSERS